HRWIGRGSRICWPARSPDLTPLDFFLWGHVKSPACNDIPTTAHKMQERIVHACNAIPAMMIDRTRKNFVFRIRKCLEVNGNHFEHLLE
ncbi:hypothetical protein WH47_06168, partial [Habropoda laboriosa]